MSESLISVFLGLIFTFSFFVISVFLVVGVKSVYLFFKLKFIEKVVPPVPAKAQAKKRRKRKPVRSIEINPEETTRIVVKKTG